MMDIVFLTIIAAMQGLTEFLPVSSSAHLLLIPLFTDWPDQGLSVDIAAHGGSLCAVVWYYRKVFLGKENIGGVSLSARLIALLGIASIPVLLLGWLSHDFISTALRQPVVITAVIGVSTIMFGLALWQADYYGSKTRQLSELRIRDALLIGLAQCLALIPGTSRAGITITAALWLGMPRRESATLALLLAIPVIAAATGYELLQLLQSDAEILTLQFIFTLLLSALFSWLGLRLLLQVLEYAGVLPFVIYRLLLGSVLLITIL